MSMTASLLMLPQWLALFLILGAAVLPALTAFFVVHRWVPAHVRRAHNDVAGFVFATVGVIYGVLLAFVVIVVWEQWYHTEVNVQQEIGAAVSLHHLMGAYAGPGREPALWPLVPAYLHEVAENEFPAMSAMAPLDRAGGALRELWTGVRDLAPGSAREQVLFDAMVGTLADLDRLRASRLNDAVHELPGIIWFALVAGAMLTIGFALFLGTENARAHAAMLSLLAALIGVVFYVTIELDLPFTGETRIGPERFLAAAESMTEAGITHR